jgi:AcrR family transcriptional regulator
VVAQAALLADEVGVERLTLAALAARLNVALPSLYKHVRNLDHLLQQVASIGTAQLAVVLVDAVAGRSRADAVRALADAYRTFARAHPGRYQAAQRVPDPSDPEHVEAGERSVGVLFAVLRGSGLAGDDAVDAARALRAGLHGFVSLELAGGFGLPVDVDRSFRQLVAALERALADWPSTVDRAPRPRTAQTT